MVVHSPAKPATPAPASSPTSSLAIASMIIGVISATMPVPFLGVIAVALGVIALKRNQPNRGLSITGIITGSINILLSFLITTMVLLMIVLAISSDGSFPEYDEYWPYEQTEQFESREA